jgi:nucleotide-binding universal stress UspA family protein
LTKGGAIRRKTETGRASLYAGRTHLAFKDLLLQLSSYPDATKLAGIEQAADFAKGVGARITALTYEMDMHVPWNATGDMIVNVSGMVAAEKTKSAKNARDVIELFEIKATDRGLDHENIVERCLSALIPGSTTEYARMSDLTIIPVGDPSSQQQYVAECVIFGSGRPVLVVPEVPKRTGQLLLENVGVAWDFSRPAARAIADALPLLQQAKTVHVVTIASEKPIETRRSGVELARHLARHSVEVELEMEDADGRSIGEALEMYALSRQLDILVMGAYGHSRFRDFVLGGATKSLVANPPIPVFFSH